MAALSLGRHIPAAVKRAVWKQDGGRCAFVSSHGRCSSHAFLEYHHLKPFADGGEAIVENIELRCRAHNAYEATLAFGSDWVREGESEYGDAFRNELSQ